MQVFPSSLFVVLNDPLIHEVGRSWKHPNVRFASDYGLDLDGKISLARQADLFIGCYDEFAVVVAGLSTPALVMLEPAQDSEHQTLMPRPNQ